VGTGFETPSAADYAREIPPSRRTAESRSEQGETTAQLLLIEPASSPFFARIVQAAGELDLRVNRLDAPSERPPDGAVVGIGPSVADPVQVARDIRQFGGQPLLVFFSASPSERDAIDAELVRDPFISERYELIEMTANQQQLARRIRQAGARVERTRHADTRPRRAAPRSRGRATEPVHLEHLGNLLTQANEAILSINAQGVIETWNLAAEHLFGFRHGAALGQSVAILNLGGAAADIETLSRQVLRTGEPAKANLRCRRADDEPIQVAVSVAPIADRQGRLLGASVIARDDTSHQRIEEALREANRQKDEFLAIMSHELRTPLTSILGYTDMLLRGLGGELAPRSNRYVTNVRAAGDRLLELVNGLLDFTRLESGAERLETQPVDLHQVVRQVVDKCRAAAESKQIGLQFSVDGPVGQVAADDDKLQQVLRNYVGNALKFTPEGGQISIHLSRDPEDADRARVEVSDSGVGMRDEQITRVWQRFYQGDASLTRPHGGMGIGLSIARHLVHLHGGDVGAESQGPGRGSTFWFSLPLLPERPNTARTTLPREETRS
jgi:PAS domain S-box-containing protein